MAGNHLSPPEKQMKDTIDFLMRLPPDERAALSDAENLTFTVSEKAPAVPAISGAGASTSSTQTFYLLGGALDAIPLLTERNLRPVVLSFAHGYNCGGGFEHSGGSQEEFIWRASSVFLSLWPHRRVDDGPGVLRRGMWIGEYDRQLPRADAWYPHTEYGGIYSPNVRLLRNLELRGQPLLKPEEYSKVPGFAVLTIAAQDCNRDRGFRVDDLKEKLRTTLYTAYAKGHQAIVLGAFGCGYFRNPPRVVADVTKRLLGTEFKDKFRVVLLAIPDLGGPNRQAFEACFGSAQPLRDLGPLLAQVCVDGPSEEAASAAPAAPAGPAVEAVSKPRAKRWARCLGRVGRN